MNKLHLLLIGIFLGIVFPTGIFASPISFSVSPQKFDIALFPGESYQGEISIANRSEVAVPVASRSITFTAAEDTGEMIFVGDGDLLESPGKWVNFSSNDFILGSGERRTISFEVEVPREARPGGYSAFVFFEPRMPDEYFQEGATRAIPVIGVPVLISAQSLHLDSMPGSELEVVEFSLQEDRRMAFLEGVLSEIERVSFLTAEASGVQATGGRPSSFNLRIRNNSDYHLRPQGQVSIKNVFGRTVGEAEVPERTILPGKTRVFPVEFTDEPPALFKLFPQRVSDFLVENFFVGRYRATLFASSSAAFSLDGGEVVQAESSLVLYSLPWVTLAFWAIFLALLFFVFFKFQRVRKALRVFLKLSKDR